MKKPHYAHPDIRDWLGAEGAQELAYRIKEYWAERGMQVAVRIEGGNFRKRTGRHRIFMVRSDLRFSA